MSDGPISSQCSLGYPTRWAGDCSEETLQNFATRACGDEERGCPGCKAPAQELGAAARLLH